ncbi:uncharacterized protein Z519_05014 [Cladophialophora bantiana CBS 173.52]|uniref:SAM-dependent MTase RsmB/NOP-type domain-containing protein n=1 Tax=Cladophialophora bantiana (strain ATCC 10958 / CBS 173.52 / CDC B-1940 / NIH 8579) TaxID=1442370 RepID=A0A0D2HS47_CLAB1|nr:uncharacterized protein Z519_05014 [Cladophialophora bantiana CBS 173.52]KIW93700.1 hypothetical protein Z519_05014 [Cladophialophora bantiana CBS 173.52]
MGKRGGKKGGRGRGSGGGGGPRPRPDNRGSKQDISRYNDKFEQYYNQLGIITDEERDDFWKAMRRDLPNSFRFTGSKAHALAVQQRLRDYYIPEITSITYEGQYVDAPRPVEWYPDQLAWFMTTPKNVIRRFKPFASFQRFLVAETDVGNITRQEVVSMIPPLVMDLKPGMTVLDLCAAPGSKSAQLLEMIHAGEEERCRRVASNNANGLDRPEGEDYQDDGQDDGRATGLLVANDVDYRRAHMLVHQMKRLSSPNIVVTNHDATIFPSIKISSLPTPEGKPASNRYLKFDRILADVPCSGDGTVRKNVEIWKNWTPSNGLGLHVTQVRILVRALQMLKVGGRVVYSTCSMNPVEDEAVLAEAINRCGGPQLVHILETKDLLPGLKRSSGLKQWNVMDKSGRIWKDYESVHKQQAEFGYGGLEKLSESMFPPKENLPLDRAMRVYPHQQDTGAFFIAILEKKSEIKAKPEEKPAATVQGPSKMDVNDSPRTNAKSEISANGGEAKMNKTVNGDSESSMKRKRENSDNRDSKLIKRIKSEEGLNDTSPSSTIHNGQSLAAQAPQPQPQRKQHPKRKNRDQPFEEPFKYLSPSLPELNQIRAFYNISPQFPDDRYMVRNPEGTPTKNIYYTNKLAKEILQENEGKGIKFVHAGVKMFVKQDAPSPEVCPWRIQTDGLRMLETWVGPERIVKLKRKETLRRLLIEMFPRFKGEEGDKLGEVGEQVREMGMGCCVLVVEPSETNAVQGTGTGGGGEEGEGLEERMVLPLWKSIHSLNLMLPKEERKAMLLRLFNDDSPLLNNSKGWLEAQKQETRTKAGGDKDGEKNDAGGDGETTDFVDKLDEFVDTEIQRNSSSPEAEPAQSEPVNDIDHIRDPEMQDEAADVESARVSDDEEEDGGVAISKNES